ncbi:Lcl C-terminal domain-containing protein [Desulforegula conservatrix]|uniref:Lcl C-terminal domain-containing protein n=1 Tax=Desulforegula conservatrix TaxID=153026 RepID=UPI0018DE158A|nr:DUF1566 domain-containing protein [Desulforegula conservatrix]
MTRKSFFLIIVAFLLFIVMAVNVSAGTTIAISKIIINSSVTPIMPGDSFSVSVEASSSDSEQMYYKFYYCPNYGTSDYETSEWVVVKDYSTAKTAAYSVPSSGNYIVVVRAVTDPANEPDALPIIGGLVSVGGDSGQVNIADFNSSATPSLKAGESVNFFLNASTPDNSQIYYKFYSCGNYGTYSYPTSTWEIMQEYSTANTCSHAFSNPGNYVVVARAVTDPANEPAALPIIGTNVAVGASESSSVNYKIVDTGQTKTYGNTSEISPPAAGQAFSGQDSQIQGNQPSYKNNGDGTITDLNTGLVWVQERGNRISWDDAVSGASSCRVGGYSDWRMPTIKELYSLIKFSGVNGPDNMVTTGFTPFIDTNYFGFVYGSGIGSERVIDCQDWSATAYVTTTMHNNATIFGVNFADGRIKGYPKYEPSSGETVGKLLYVRYVRGNPEYGKNSFQANSDSTVSDLATGLMWSKDDSRQGMNWADALAWVQAQNAANYLGHNDWRLPNAKELQSIVDYTRSPSTTNSPAIDINYFNSTAITNEAGQSDYPYIWTGTVLLDGGPSPSGVYISFGRAIGYVNGSWIDVHGAGSQKSDIMAGNPANYPNGRGPQGDAVRITNYVRLVRDI